MYNLLEYKENTILLQDDISLEIIEISYEQLELYKSQII